MSDQTFMDLDSNMDRLSKLLYESEMSKYFPGDIVDARNSLKENLADLRTAMQEIERYNRSVPANDPTISAPMERLRRNMNVIAIDFDRQTVPLVQRVLQKMLEEQKDREKQERGRNILHTLDKALEGATNAVMKATGLVTAVQALWKVFVG